MSNQAGGGFCPIHGPFDPPHTECPYCAGRPQAPPPLNDSEAPTDVYVQGGDFYDDTRPTDYGPGGARRFDDEAPTDIGLREAGLAADKTEMPRRLRGRGVREVDDLDDMTELEIKPTGILGFLIVKEGHLRGRVHQIRDRFTVGRKQTDIILGNDPKISRQHARFTLENDVFYIWDLATPNGTYVNGEKTREATALAENDVIKMGDTVFVFKILPE